MNDKAHPSPILESILSNPEIIVAICAVAISVISLVVALWSLAIQRKHNRLSVKPIAHVSYGDYEDCLYVELVNRGLGPLLITNFKAVKGSIEYDSLVASIGALPKPVIWDTFTGSLNGGVISQDNKSILLKITLTEEQEAERQAIRESLSKTEIVVEYENIYGDQQPTKTKQLTWFGR